MALESFDATGALREKDNGVSVDDAADLYDGRQIAGPAGLREALLIHEDQIVRNFAKELLTYATNRRLGPRDMATVRDIVRQAAANDNRFSMFVIAVVSSDAFRRTRPPKES